MRPSLSLTGLFMVAAVSTVEAQGLNLIPGVVEVPSERISDVAVAVVDLPDSVIYYSPSRIQAYGALLSRFMIAHEYGHFARGHSRLKLAALQAYQRDSVLRLQELEADCYAASLPGNDARAATEMAIRFFTRLGPFTFDSEHPTGAQRVAQILECLPAARQPVVFGRGDTGIDVGPVSGEPEKIQVQVRAMDLSTVRFGNEATVWIDGQRLGQISNMRAPSDMLVDHFGVGLHSYRIDLRVFLLDSAQQFTLHGSVLGRGQVLLRPGDKFRVQWAPGERPTLERETP